MQRLGPTLAAPRLHHGRPHLWLLQLPVEIQTLWPTEQAYKISKLPPSGEMGTNIAGDPQAQCQHIHADKYRTHRVCAV